MSAGLYGVATSHGFATFADGARAELYARVSAHAVRFVALGEPEHRAGMARPGWRAVSRFNLSDADAARVPRLVSWFWDQRGPCLAPDTFTRERDAHLVGAGGDAR